jgi:hypothetical protein
MLVRRSVGIAIVVVGIGILFSCVLFAQEEQKSANQEATANVSATPVEVSQAPAAAPDTGTLVKAANEETAPIEEKMTPAAQNAEQKTGAQEKNTEWVWGEVVSVDQSNQEFVIKHMDYESYEEVKTPIKTNEKTLFENAAGISEIKAGDHLTVDYKTKDGSNVAELVVVEKGTVATEEGTPAAKEATIETVAKNESTMTQMTQNVEIPAASSEATNAPVVNMTTAPVTPTVVTPPPVTNNVAAMNATGNETKQ